MPARVVASATSNSVSLGARFSPARAFYFRSTRGKRFPPQDIYRGSRLFRDSFDPGKSSQLLRRRSGVGVDPPEGTGFAFSDELISIDFVFSDSFLSHREFFTAILRKMATKMHRVSNPINFNLIEWCRERERERRASSPLMGTEIRFSSGYDNG